MSEEKEITAEKEIAEEERKALMKKRLFGAFCVVDALLCAVIIYEVVSLFIA